VGGKAGGRAVEGKATGPRSASQGCSHLNARHLDGLVEVQHLQPRRGAAVARPARTWQAWQMWQAMRHAATCAAARPMLRCPTRASATQAQSGQCASVQPSVLAYR
jgi:hypothetical protein